MGTIGFSPVSVFATACSRAAIAFELELVVIEAADEVIGMLAPASGGTPICPARTVKHDVYDIRRPFSATRSTLSDVVRGNVTQNSKRRGTWLLGTRARKGWRSIRSADRSGGNTCGRRWSIRW